MNRRKDLIKNIAIIFLAVMLVLTFFSNTIMNWSLPEVSGKYTEYGDIKTGIRGSGTVVANLTYTETVKGNRKIEEVYVSRGSEVVAGQTLMLLSASDSGDIEALKAEIETLEDAYNRGLLTKPEYDYYEDELSIQIKEEELASLKEERAVFTDAYIAEIKKNAETAKTELDTATELLESLEEEFQELSEKSENSEITLAREERDKAQERVDIAKEALEKAEKELAKLSNVDTGSLNSQLEGLYDSLDSLKTDLKYLEEDSAELLSINADMTAKKTAYESALSDYEKAVEDFGETSPEAEEKKLIKEEKESQYNTALDLYKQNESEIKSALRGIEAKRSSISDVEYDIYVIRNEISAANRENKEYNDYKNTVTIKEKALKTEEDNLKLKEEALTKVIEKVNKKLSDDIKAAKKNIEELTEKKSEADKKLLELDTVETLDAEIKNEERSLDQMKRALEKKKESDSKAQELDEYDRNKAYLEIQKKKEELKKLQGNSKEAYELKASRNGTVTEVSFRAGEVAVDGAAAVVIEVEESGYTLSFSVETVQANRLKIGDTATVSDTYWGQSVGAVLSDIVQDSGGKTKTLVFELDGNVNVGQTLTLTVGERTTGYSAVIPKSALHEDAEGKFVYITKTKSTPLGDRFVATRLNVSVAASDDKNVAITTDENYIYEYVITSSTKPFEEGGYVRLSD